MVRVRSNLLQDSLTFLGIVDTNVCQLRLPADKLRRQVGIGSLCPSQDNSKRELQSLKAYSNLQQKQFVQGDHSFNAYKVAGPSSFDTIELAQCTMKNLLLLLCLSPGWCCWDKVIKVVKNILDFFLLGLTANAENNLGPDLSQNSSLLSTSTVSSQHTSSRGWSCKWTWIHQYATLISTLTSHASLPIESTRVERWSRDA